MTSISVFIWAETLYLHPWSAFVR